MTRFSVKGRIKYLDVQRVKNSSKFRCTSVLFDKESEIDVISLIDCDVDDVIKFYNQLNVIIYLLLFIT